MTGACSASDAACMAATVQRAHRPSFGCRARLSKAPPSKSKRSEADPLISPRSPPTRDRVHDPMSPTRHAVHRALHSVALPRRTNLPDSPSSVRTLAHTHARRTSSSHAHTHTHAYTIVAHARLTSRERVVSAYPCPHASHRRRCMLRRPTSSVRAGAKPRD